MLTISKEAQSEIDARYEINRTLFMEALFDIKTAGTYSFQDFGAFVTHLIGYFKNHENIDDGSTLDGIIRCETYLSAKDEQLTIMFLAGLIAALKNEVLKSQIKTEFAHHMEKLPVKL